MADRPRILVVDDEMIIRDSLKAWLEEDNFTVETAEGGMQAIEKLKGWPADAIVADVKMPGMDGITLLKQIQEINKNLPVIMITAHATVDSAVQCMKDGAYDYIMKPFPPEKLSTLLRRVIEHKRLEEDNVRLRKERSHILHVAITALVSFVILVLVLYFVFNK